MIFLEVGNDFVFDGWLSTELLLECFSESAKPDLVPPLLGKNVIHLLDTGLDHLVVLGNNHG
jgi:hypothetical protein